MHIGYMWIYEQLKSFLQFMDGRNNPNYENFALIFLLCKGVAMLMNVTNGE